MNEKSAPWQLRIEELARERDELRHKVQEVEDGEGAP